MRYHYTSFKIAKITKQHKPKYMEKLRLYQLVELELYQWQNHIGTVCYFLKKLHLLYDPAIPFSCIHLQDLKIYICTKIYCWIFTVIMVQTEINRGIDKQIVVYSYKGIILSNKNSLLINEAPWINMLSESKLSTKGYIL